MRALKNAAVVAIVGLMHTPCKAQVGFGDQGSMEVAMRTASPKEATCGRGGHDIGIEETILARCRHVSDRILFYLVATPRGYTLEIRAASVPDEFRDIPQYQTKLKEYLGAAHLLLSAVGLKDEQIQTCASNAFAKYQPMRDPESVQIATSTTILSCRVDRMGLTVRTRPNNRF